MIGADMRGGGRMKNYTFIRPDPTLKTNLMKFGFECGHGWDGILEDLFDGIQKIVDDKPELKDFELTQVKEKFGMLRVYCSFNIREIDALIDKAEKRSAETCEDCGKPGTFRVMNHWYYTRCDRCSKKISEGI